VLPFVLSLAPMIYDTVEVRERCRPTEQLLAVKALVAVPTLIRFQQFLGPDM
jgi:hypothetical protein